MRVKIFSLPILLAFLIWGCQEEKSPPIIGLNYQSFSINCQQDTILYTDNGVEILIAQNSINCDGDGPIEIQVATILDQVDMIKYQIYPIEENGGILESGGMINFQIVSGQSVNASAPIQVVLPSKYLKEGMSLYQGQMDGGMLTWSNTNQAIESLQGENIKLGEQLYINNCATCHSKNLRQDLTGPALGNVHLHRNPGWLLRYTRDAMDMVSQGDTLAHCIWYEWQPSAMPNFRPLSDNEIVNIYQYIAHESEVQNIEEDEVSYVKDCVFDPDFVQGFSGGDWGWHGGGSPRWIDTTYQYLLEIYNSNGWYNVDQFWDISTEIEPIIVQLEKGDNKNLEINLVFEDRNIAIPFVADKKGTYILLNSQGKEKLNFPIGDATKIVAYQFDNKARKITDYTILDYTIRENDNDLELALEPLGDRDFFELLKEEL